MKPEFNFTDFILTKFSKTVTRPQGVQQLIARYQTLAILYINFFFLTVLIMWKIFSLAFGPLPGDEVTVVFVPIQIISLTLMKSGKKDLAALALLIAIQIGNFMASKVCNVTLGASFLLMVLPGISYFVSSSKKIQLINLVFCLGQNIGHMWRLHEIFKVTFTEEQHFQIFTLVFVSMMYIPLSWSLFAFQKYIETDLWQVAQLNYEKAEKITKELIEAVESKDRVVSSFSHEIRNPLNSLNGNIDYLLKTIHDPKHKKVLKNAQLSGEILINLVNNILDAAKLKSEKMEIACGEANPADVIKKVLTINSEIISQKNITARAYIHKHSPHRLYIDASRLLQVVMNLFCNAVKFTDQNGKIDIFMEWMSEDTPRDQLLNPFSVRHASDTCLDESESIDRLPRLTTFKSDPNLKDIEEFEETGFIDHSKNILHLESGKHRARLLGDVRSHTEWMTKNFDVISPKPSSSQSLNDNGVMNLSQNRKGFLKVQITDSGCGITNENISKLFQMFSQVEINPNAGGTGLGLWISKQLCQKMGGDIVIYSKVGLGTTTVFYIAVDNNSLPSYSIHRPVSHGIDKVRALVVDDYSYNRDVHKLILEREGVEVSLAEDGKEACEKYMTQQEGYFSFILMDIHMPVMDGIKAAREIRKFEAQMNRKQTEIYFVSGNYYSKAEAFRTFSPNGEVLLNTQFLRKPIDLEMIKKISDKYGKSLERNT